MSEWDLDLLGDPIPEGLGKRGRPPHLVTNENRCKVIALAGLGSNEQEIADAIGITRRTLQKHYFRELRALDQAKARLKAKAAMALLKKIEAGDTSAIALLFKRLDKADLSALAGLVADRGKSGKPVKLGKKEAAKEAAAGVKGRYAPPAGPQLLN